MEAVTPIKKLVAVYQNYNKLSLDVNHLVCFKCNQWLKSPIYLSEEHHNICDMCRKRYKGNIIRNKTLEQLLNNTKYPCKYLASGCNVFDVNIAKHEDYCEQNMKCSECGKQFAKREDLMKHLTETHGMEELAFEKPTTNVLVNNFDPSAKLYHLKMMGNSIVLRLLLHVARNQISFTFCNAADVFIDCNVTIMMEINGCEYRKKDQLRNWHHLWKPDEHYTVMHVPNMEKITGSITLKVYFANYEQVEPFIESMDSLLKELECPICLETISGSLYQCRNGHNVCNNCKPKINTCPICRLPINATNIKITNLLSHLWRPCTNANFGCFVYKQGAALELHERTCPWKKIECVICKFKCNKTTIVEHMMKEHGAQKSTGFWMDVVPGYVSYNGRIFKFDFQVDITAKIVKWYLCLLHVTDDEAHQYEYNLRMKIDDVTLQTSCMSQLNESYNTMSCSFASAKPIFSCMMLLVGGMEILKRSTSTPEVTEKNLLKPANGKKSVPSKLRIVNMQQPQAQQQQQDHCCAMDPLCRSVLSGLCSNTQKTNTVQYQTYHPYDHEYDF